MTKLTSKARALAVWLMSASGRKDVGAFIAAATALYTALHRAGL